MNEIIFGQRITLKRLGREFATQRYVEWMNDKGINQYLESRRIIQSIDSINAFIDSVSNDSNFAFAIIDNKTNLHIGNIKIGGINKYHKFADLGFLIGDKAFWGKGYATEAIKMCVKFAFENLLLHKLLGGVYSPNIGSIRAFEKAGLPGKVLSDSSVGLIMVSM